MATISGDLEAPLGGPLAGVVLEFVCKYSDVVSEVAPGSTVSVTTAADGTYSTTLAASIYDIFLTIGNIRDQIGRNVIVDGNTPAQGIFELIEATEAVVPSLFTITGGYDGIRPTTVALRDVVENPASTEDLAYFLNTNVYASV